MRRQQDKHSFTTRSLVQDIKGIILLTCPPASIISFESLSFLPSLPPIEPSRIGVISEGPGGELRDLKIPGEARHEIILTC
jgi:hypothetical protein